nr:MarR family transcriptional regulator [Caldovatus aquaticus]
MIPGRGWDLTLRQLAVVLLVHDGGAPRTCCALAERLAIPRPAMTRALHRLAALGLVRRATDPVCRRRVLVRPTTRGRAFVGALRRCLARDAC